MLISGEQYCEGILYAKQQCIMQNFKHGDSIIPMLGALCPIADHIFSAFHSLQY